MSNEKKPIKEGYQPKEPLVKGYQPKKEIPGGITGGYTPTKGEGGSSPPPKKK